MDMITIQSDKLKKIGTEIFKAQGMSDERAAFIAETLVEASLTGHDSHGVYYYVKYSERIKDGFIDPEGEPAIAMETPTTALIDGRWAPGQITAFRVIETAVERSPSQSRTGDTSGIPRPSDVQQAIYEEEIAKREAGGPSTAENAQPTVAPAEPGRLPVGPSQPTPAPPPDDPPEFRDKGNSDVPWDGILEPPASARGVTRLVQRIDRAQHDPAVGVDQVCRA